MDPWKSAQDVLRCTLCQTPENPMYCEVCHLHLCKDCIERHSSKSSKSHKVVPLEQYLKTLNYPKCRKHPTTQCELHCEQCDIPICVKCISSKKHSGHAQVELLKKSKCKKEVLQRDLQELEKFIYPTYKEIESNVAVQKADLSKNSEKLTTTINKQGELWHKEIDTIITNLISNVEEMESKHLVVLNKQGDEIARTISEITQSIAELNKILNSKDICLVSKYESRIVKFRSLPPKFKVSLPSFKPQEIHTDQLTEQFGSLSALSFTTEEQDYSMPPQGAESSSPDRSLMDVPNIITAIDTDLQYMFNLACLNETHVWTCSDDNMIKLYNIRGELVKYIRTKTGYPVFGIAVTRSGDLVYADHYDRTVNIVKNTKIQTVIKSQSWNPINVCSSYSGDLLVVMDNDNIKQTKVKRYSGSTAKQSIQFNDKGQPLFSPCGVLCNIKYISENRNLDICVSDRDAGAVVVVNQTGKLRFTYTGPSSTTKDPFRPCGITTDSQGRILTADQYNDCIHILDQDGQFLRYIDNCDLRSPRDLCVDTKDNLFVAECKYKVGQVKKIQYNM